MEWVKYHIVEFLQAIPNVLFRVLQELGSNALSIQREWVCLDVCVSVLFDTDTQMYFSISKFPPPLGLGFF